MTHIISNPHNGSPVEHDGVALLPGYEVAVPEREAEALSQRFPFLLMRVVAGKGSKKPVKIKGRLEWNTEVSEDPDVVDGVSHVADTKKAKKAAAPRVRKAAPKKRR